MKWKLFICMLIAAFFITTSSFAQDHRHWHHRDWGGGHDNGWHGDHDNGWHGGHDHGYWHGGGYGYHHRHHWHPHSEIVVQGRIN